MGYQFLPATRHRCRGKTPAIYYLLFSESIHKTQNKKPCLICSVKFLWGSKLLRSICMTTNFVRVQSQKSSQDQHTAWFTDIVSYFVWLQKFIQFINKVSGRPTFVVKWLPITYQRHSISHYIALIPLKILKLLMQVGWEICFVFMLILQLSQHHFYINKFLQALISTSQNYNATRSRFFLLISVFFFRNCTIINVNSVQLYILMLWEER